MDKVKLTFTDGKSITLELFPEHAPISVENFLSLVKSGFYNGLCFHRVIDGFMIQGGGFTHTAGGLAQKPAPRTIKGEFSKNGVLNPVKHTPGTLSMARTNVHDSGSSQFFICVADAAFLDGQYAAFGRTADESSLKTAIELGRADTCRNGMYDDVPRTPIVIERAEVL